MSRRRAGGCTKRPTSGHSGPAPFSATRGLGHSLALGHARVESLGRRRAAVPERGGDGPRLNDGYVDAPGRHFETQRVGHRLQRELGGRLGGHEGCGHAARDGADVDDTPPASAQEGQEGLGHRDLAHHVELEPPSHLGQRQELQGPR